MNYRAAALTALAAILILLLLMFGYLYVPLPSAPQRSEVAVLTDPEEELFVEPELTDLGEAEAVTNDAPAEAVKGVPKEAPVEKNEVIEPGTKPTPAPPAPQMVTQKKESTVKAPESSATDKERQEATAAVASKFSSKTGAATGTDKGTSGVGGTGVGIAGNAYGRTFQGCPKPDVTLRHKTVVKVSILIDADGKVVEATASGSADAAIRRKCEQAALKARWSAKPGATPTRGTLTFTITPV